MRAEGDVLIIGAGPVGLTLANLLGAAGIPCLLLDRRTETPLQSRAIGVAPPSLAIMESVGCLEALMGRGVPIRDAVVWDGRRTRGTLTFRHLPGRYPMVLAVPQRETMRILEDRLPAWSCVCYQDGMEFLGLRDAGPRPEIRLRDLRSGRESTVAPSLLIGCDGHRSAVREAAGFACARKRYRTAFSMADFEGGPSMGSPAHLFFTEKGAVESFPLPGGRRRWIVQMQDLRDRLDGPGLVECVRARTGADLAAADGSDVSWFQPQRQCAGRFAAGRIVLCGDSAHVMTPIGGQGMNTGLADARHAAEMIGRWRAGASWKRLCAAYDRRRRRAFRFAADRAALGMWIGTRKGPLARPRSALVARCLRSERLARAMAMHYAMLTVPPDGPARSGRTCGGRRDPGGTG
ncbi:MAG: FAD-dependent monooxygenase [Candidatus Brocadiaceae bacterium]|nr:FAD-dependent monooxygenase [Candidatus Brocadiaceae bacterium]